MNTDLEGKERRDEELAEPVGPTDEEYYRTTRREFEKQGADGAGDEVRAAGEQARQKARETTEAAKERGRTIVGRQQQSAAQEIGKYGSALHAAAQRLRDEKAALAGVADTAADQLDKASRYMKDHSPEEMVRAANDYARRHPGAVWGSMLFAGFALSRFFKASEHPHR